MLNFSLPKHNLSIFLGDLELTNALISLSIRRPRAELSTPQTWSGNLEIATVRGLSESLDDLENPCRFAVGKYPLIININNYSITLRIKRYFYDDINGIGQAELTDQLGLRDFENPPEDWIGLYGDSYGNLDSINISVSAVITKILEKAGLTVGTIDISGSYEIPPNKFQESYISFAQKICGERGYWLYCDENETIQAIKYEAEPDTILFTKTRNEVDNFDRQRGLEIPYESITVSGTADKIADYGDGTTVAETYQKIGSTQYLQRRITITKETSATKATRRVKIEETCDSAFGDVMAGNLSLIISNDTIETSYYDAEGKLTEYRRETDQPKGICLSEYYPGETIMVRPAEIEEQTYDSGGVSSTTTDSDDDEETISDDDAVLRNKWSKLKAVYPTGALPGQEDKGVPAVFGPGYITAGKQEITETWKESKDYIGDDEDRPPNERYDYTRTEYGRKDPRIVDKEGILYYELGYWYFVNLELKEDQSPPAWPTGEPEYPVGQVEVEGEVNFTLNDCDPVVEREYDYNCSYLQDDSECEILAELLGTLQQQRYKSRLISLPIPIEYLANLKPFSAVNIHNGQFIVDSPVLLIEKSGEKHEAIFSFIGNYVGKNTAGETKQDLIDEEKTLQYLEASLQKAQDKLQEEIDAGRGEEELALFLIATITQLEIDITEAENTIIQLEIDLEEAENIVIPIYTVSIPFETTYKITEKFTYSDIYTNSQTSEFSDEFLYTGILIVIDYLFFCNLDFSLLQKAEYNFCNLDFSLLQKAEYNFCNLDFNSLRTYPLDFCNLDFSLLQTFTTLDFCNLDFSLLQNNPNINLDFCNIDLTPLRIYQPVAVEDFCDLDLTTLRTDPTTYSYDFCNLDIATLRTDPTTYSYDFCNLDLTLFRSLTNNLDYCELDYSLIRNLTNNLDFCNLDYSLLRI